jgi:hypothetical protein
METIRIEILNPKAKAILKDLANLDLIRIKGENVNNNFSDILKKLRSQQEQIPNMVEITKEVEAARQARYEK